MAVYKADILDIELNTGNIARSFLCHNIGKDDTKADRFGVRVFRDGVAESLSGCSIQGYMMRPNGTNLAITGSNTGVSGNEAWVDLPQAAYDYEGQFCLALKLIGGGVTGTIRIIDGMINNTFVDDALVPMQSVPTYQEILAVYDQMVAAKNGSVRFDQSQSLTETQKSVARMNIDAARDSDVSDLKSALSGISAIGNSVEKSKNLVVINPEFIEKEINGLVISWDSDREALIVNGTASATTNIFIDGTVAGCLSFPAGTYTFTLSDINGFNSSARIAVKYVYTRGDSSVNIVNQSTSGRVNTVTFTAPSCVFIQLFNGDVYSNASFKLQVEKGSTSTEYARPAGVVDVVARNQVASVDKNVDEINEILESTIVESPNLFVLTENETYPLTKNGVTLSQESDGTLVLNGTTTVTTQFVLGLNSTARTDTWIPAGTYSFGMKFLDGFVVTGGSYFALKTSQNGSVFDVINAAPETRIAENVVFTEDRACYIQLAKNMTYTNCRVTVMINAGATLLPYEQYGESFVDRTARYETAKIPVLISSVETLDGQMLSDVKPLNIVGVSGKENVTGGIAGGTNADYVYTGVGVEWASGSTPGITVLQINAPCVIALTSADYEMTINQYNVHLGQHKSGQWVKNWTDGEYKTGPLSVEITADSYPAYFAIGLHSATGVDISSLAETIFANNVTVQYIRSYDGYKKPQFVSLSMFKRIAVTGCSWPAGRGYRWESWAGNIARRNSVVVMDYAIGGTNIVNWYNNKANTAESIGAGMKNMMADDACHLYVLNFGGVNDRNEFNNGTHSVGTIADCQAAEKPLTYYGYFGRIIEMIHTHAPYAAIIVSSPDCTPFYNAVGTSGKNFTEINAEIADYYNGLSGYRVAYMDITKDPYYHTYVTDLLLQHPTVITHSGAAMMYERCISQTVEENEEVFVVSPAHFDEMDTVAVQWVQLEDTDQTDEEPDVTTALPVKCTPYDELEARVAALEAAIANLT